MTTPGPGDPFGTASLRRRVLDAWTASPARFREDANAEEDYALGAYRDRLVVELAQNAADAAVRAGTTGRLLLRLAPDPVAPAGLALTAANTGAPVDADGVQALATLRASAKRDDDGGATVGRFGVGFAAVLDVTDEPALRSASGGVRWSRSATADEVAGVPALAAEVAQRGGHVPVLRLPWPDAVPPPPGYDSAVVMPLRDRASVERVRAALAEVDEALLLMLPALAEVEIDDGSDAAPRVVRAADLRVRRVVASGPLDRALLAGRPAEERRTSRWSVVWALPRPAGTRAVLHAPTPTDEPVGLPAALVASFPLDPTRRHVAPGPLRDHLVGRAAEAYADLVRAVASDPSGARAADEVLGLVPGPVAAGALDADLRQAVLALLPSVPLLPGGLRPEDAVAVDGLSPEAADVLAEVLPGLVPPSWAGRRELDRLGVRRTRLADLVDDLAALDRPAAWWARLHATMAGTDRDALSGLPVPLVDGRLVRGPRGVVVGADPELAEVLGRLALRVADPAVSDSPAAVDLLLRLGAVPADAAALLDEPAVRAAVEASLDADEPGAVADAVLRLVRDSGRDAARLPWLGRLALPDDEGGWSEAGDLVLRDGGLDGVLRPGGLGHPDPALVGAWGDSVLVAVGVLTDFAVVHDEDLALDLDTCDHDLDGEDGWLDDVLDRLEATGPTGDLPPTLPSFAAVRDLDLVADERWPEALRLLAGDPGLRAAVVEPAAVLLADGRRVDVEPYTAWWLRTHAVLGGSRPDELRAPGTPALAGLLAEAPDVGVDAAFLRALGVVTSVADVAASPMVLPLVAAGVAPEGARPDGPGVPRPVPDVAARVLAEVPASYVEHDDLTVSGVACDWWVDETGVVHAATLDGLGRGLAWAAGEWGRRLLLAAVLADPEHADDLLAEDSWG